MVCRSSWRLSQEGPFSFWDSLYPVWLQYLWLASLSDSRQFVWSHGKPSGATRGKKKWCVSQPSGNSVASPVACNFLFHMPVTCSKTCCNTRELSPIWEAELGKLPDEPTPPASTSAHEESPSKPKNLPVHKPSPRTPSLSRTPELFDSKDLPNQVKNAKNPWWKPWQDCFLVAEALKHQPFLAVRSPPIQET